MFRVLFTLLPLLTLGWFAAAAAARAPLIQNPVLLNIGYVCRWQAGCMDRQERAMKRALRYVRKHDTPIWKVQLCNRNASRGSSRVDWIGYYNCVRNKIFRPPRGIARK